MNQTPLSRHRLLAELYRLTFTADELTLLTTTDPGLLTPLESQRRYILGTALEPIHCPACGYLTCRRAACTVEDFTGSRQIIPDDAYACPNCGAGLTWSLALVGGYQAFTLTPGQTVTVTSPDEQEERGPCICEGRAGHTNPDCPWYGTDGGAS
jgi:hypothetical protein